jgi:cephalosporin hydroxylase
MLLKDLINRKKSDKDTVHSYIELYDKLLDRLKDTALNVIEIGISKGGSIKMWKDYFTRANVYGIDLTDYKKLDHKNGIDDVAIKYINNELIKEDRINLFIGQSGYDKNFIDKKFKDIKFDFVIDDGPHTLQSMKDCINLYLPLLSENGILIIEDVQNILWFNELEKETPEEYKENIFYYDRRFIKGRYDDLVFVINKNKNI